MGAVDAGCSGIAPQGRPDRGPDWQGARRRWLRQQVADELYGQPAR